MRVIRAGVRSQPVLCGSVTAFARDTITDFKDLTSEGRRDILEWRVTRRTSGIGSRVFDLQGVRNLFRAGGGECGKWPFGMEIAQRPDEKLILVMAAATVAARTGTRSRPDVFGDDSDSGRGFRTAGFSAVETKICCVK